MKPIFPKTIAVAGLGLMGGSLAASCRRKFRRSRIIGISRNPQALRAALKKGWVHQATPDLERGIRDADLIVLCTPVDTFASMLRRIDRAATRRVLVTDVGSVKGEICGWAEKRPWRHVRFAGAHPMVGSHERGLDAAVPDLYDSGFTFFVRSSVLSLAENRKVKNFWREISPRVIEIEAGDHDRVVGEISHLPHVAAVCLVLAAGNKSLRFAASGFRDSTRIAASHPSIWVPIYLSNRKALIRAMDRYERGLKSFRAALRSLDAPALNRMLEKASRVRAEI